VSHTPGPWKQEHAIYRYYEITREGYWVARTRGAENARLIAAAPELLKALQAMLTHMGMDEDEWNKPTFDQARAAIAKATGEQA